MLPSGAVFFILIAAVLLAATLAWVVALLYQRRMLTLMRGNATPGPAATANDAAATVAVHRPAWNRAVDLAANRRANTRLLLGLSAGSLLIALSQSWLALLFVYQDRALSLGRVLVLGPSMPGRRCWPGDWRGAGAGRASWAESPATCWRCRCRSCCVRAPHKAWPR